MKEDSFSSFETKAASYIFLMSHLFITLKFADESKAMVSVAVHCFTTR